MSGRVHDEQDWNLEILALADSLREMGYDIEPPLPGESSVASVIARRDLGDRAVLLVIDAGGRFRAAITWVVGEWPSRDAIGGVPVRVVDAVSRAVTVNGQVERLDRFGDVIAGLATIASWASVAAPVEPIPVDEPERNY